MTALVRDGGLVFHMKCEETGSEDDHQFRKQRRPGQSQIDSRLLIGCGKLEIPVHDCGK